MDSKVQQYKILHSNDDTYGKASLELVNEVSVFIEFLKPKVILDYGCGKGALVKELQKLYPKIDIYGYDPAISENDILPNIKPDLIINTDVLEHIPEQELPEVIKRISMIGTNCFFYLHHKEAAQILPNGENAHCTIKPPIWYHKLLSQYFKVINPLEGIVPWRTAVVTFYIDDVTKDKYLRIVKKKKLLRKIYFFVEPIYVLVRPLIYPIVRYLKNVFLK